MNLSEFVFKKKYGQNFLIDSNILKKIVNLANVTKDSLVIEIGCGSGALTKELCGVAKNVIGYEIDLSTKKYLDDTLSLFSNYKIIFDDFLKRDLLADIKDVDYDEIYVIANLPYYITTPIIEKLIDSKIKFKKIIVMVQKEVGERFSANPGCRNYSSITVFLNYYFNIYKRFLVSRNCFMPKPNIDSVIIEFESKDNHNKVDDEILLFKIIRDSFRFKRKTLKNNLRDYNLEKIEKVLKNYNLDLNARAEQLDLSVFCDLVKELSI